MKIILTCRYAFSKYPPSLKEMLKKMKVIICMVLNHHILAEKKIYEENIQNVQSTYINTGMNSTIPSTQAAKYIFLHGKYLQDQR